MILNDIKAGCRISGLLPNETVSIEKVSQFGDEAAEIIYRRDDGSLEQRILYANELDGISVVLEGVPWRFNADAHKVKLASEAYRIRLAHLFDPHLAVHTSQIEPLPHQITAVYEEMLPRQPLRFLLADDPGAGKTIMTGLLIKELKMRGDLNRCLIVCPGNLVMQWQEELESRFQLKFEILSKDDTHSQNNPFAEIPLCIARLDKLSRDEEIQEKLKRTDWDLIVCDEAHKMSATLYGSEEKHTKRYNLGLLLSEITRHFLLLTATPHNGKEDDFRLFMRLLDKDRFLGTARNRDKRENVASDMMRRLVKEQLLTFDCKPLFPERIAHTLSYQLSSTEKELYDKVTEYVREGFNKADSVLAPDKAVAVGFALTVLQRRLASSPEAIYQSLTRRRERLEKRLKEEASEVQTLSREDFDDIDEATDEEFSKIENEALDESTWAKTKEELENEIIWLSDLEKLALKLRNSGVDRKWDELSKALQSEKLMFKEKIIIFTEHRDTLRYLVDKIRNLLGKHDAVVSICGG